jgi:hypothetical protein
MIGRLGRGSRTQGTRLLKIAREVQSRLVLKQISSESAYSWRARQRPLLNKVSRKRSEILDQTPKGRVGPTMTRRFASLDN